MSRIALTLTPKTHHLPERACCIDKAKDIVFILIYYFTYMIDRNYQQFTVDRNPVTVNGCRNASILLPARLCAAFSLLTAFAFRTQEPLTD